MIEKLPTEIVEETGQVINGCPTVRTRGPNWEEMVTKLNELIDVVNRITQPELGTAIPIQNMRPAGGLNFDGSISSAPNP